VRFWEALSASLVPPESAMQQRSEFIDWLEEQLAPLGRVRVRRMFGSQGLYLDGLFIGIVHEDTLYLKSAKEARPELAKAGAEPFRYSTKDGHERELGLMAPPAAVLEDQDSLLAWVRQAMDAALQARAAKPNAKARKHA
jgi:DNA transformation protein and related proteins